MCQTLTAEEAVASVQSNSRVFVHGSAATPLHLLHALARRDDVKNIETVHMHLEGDIPLGKEEHKDKFFPNCIFVGSNLRHAVQHAEASYIPVFLSEAPGLFTSGVLPLDYALVHVSPPDRHGYCSLGTSVDISVAAVSAAKHVIAQVNPHMPRTHGDGLIHISRIDTLVPVDEPLIEHHSPTSTPEVFKAIGENVASLIENGACLQMGIGGVPDAVLKELMGHKELGIHTEMFSDGLLPLIEAGIITNEHTPVHRNVIVASFLVGTRKLFDFVDDNPMVRMTVVDVVNDPAVIKNNPKTVAINSAVEIDLTGQVCADSIGPRVISGVGGQMDFMRGAALSKGGKPILALPSLTKRGESRIVPMLKEGAGVVTTRSHIHYVVTEYGVARLYGKNLLQRQEELIRIAHPDHRGELRSAVDKRYWLSFSP